LALLTARSMATSISPLHESIILAIVFVSFGVLVKFAGRRDNDPSPKRNEFAVSTSVSLMTLSKIFADLFANTPPSHALLLMAAIGLLPPLFFAVFDRYVSWDASNAPPKKKIWLGIVVPDIMAILVLFSYYWLRYSGEVIK
jgi:hypothetical protein